ncbi:Fe2OG dioxygenase domain-containing protein [Mycena kentingensis (nom. inval.)]|nr:Fe2OG dioxygenase domain-containing protein [Mycena kentingensis (nom. inval.)]
MPGSWTISDHIINLKTAVAATVPYTCGVQTVRKEDLGLFFATDDHGARSIDFANPVSEEQLQQLAGACDKASFGTKDGDVFDETVRKAGKMELEKFAARLDIHACGLLDAVAEELLVPETVMEDEWSSSPRDAPEPKFLRAEMYKLNVYGPGSFFHAHKDTPRAENMVGSLVVIFPTEHEGGALKLQHAESRWAFDSAAQLKGHRESSEGAPAIAYVAFFSDVSHTVEEVTAGYRVTLTYNLFIESRGSGGAAQTVRSVPGPELICETSLRALLADPDWFPNGGLLAFGLAHQYPMLRDSLDRVPMLKPALLKGSDARLCNAARRAGLEPRIRLVYNIDEEEDDVPTRRVVLDQIATMWDSSRGDDDGNNADYELEEQGRVLQDIGEDGRLSIKHPMKQGEWDRPRTTTASLGVYWVVEPSWINQAPTQYPDYLGNESGVLCIYGDAALFMQIPAATDDARAVFA